jgi:hypothetical protein
MKVFLVYLTDDHFLLKRNRINDICQGIIKRNLQFKWGCEGSPFRRRKLNRKPELPAWMLEQGLRAPVRSPAPLASPTAPAPG